LDVRFFCLVVLVVSVIGVTPFSVYEQAKLHLPAGRQEAIRHLNVDG
jgi:hypothetical protein